MRLVFAANREWLAGWSSSQKLNVLRDGGPVERSDITFMKGPATNKGVVAPLILADRVTRPLVPLDHGQVLETGNFASHGQTAGSCEKLNRSHSNTPVNFA
ncbi:hypothetical protein D3C72_2194190 [compost metagenome]